MEEINSINKVVTGEVSAFQLNLCTKGHCFLCLKPASLLISNGIKIKTEKEDRDNGGSKTKNENKQDTAAATNEFPPTSLLLQHLCRHLKIDISKIATEFIKTPDIIEMMGLTSIEKAEMKVTLCELCTSVTGKISTLFDQIAKIKMEIDLSLDRVKRRISSAEDDGELLKAYRKSMAVDIHSLLLSGFIDQLKKEISKQCELRSLARFNEKPSPVGLSLSRIAQSLAKAKPRFPELKPLASVPTTSGSSSNAYNNAKTKTIKIIDMDSESSTDDDDDEEQQESTTHADSTSMNTPDFDAFIVPKQLVRKNIPPAAPKLDKARLKLITKKLKFKCKICKKSFPRMVDVKTHKKMAHPAQHSNKLLSIPAFAEASNVEVFQTKRQPKPTFKWPTSGSSDTYEGTMSDGDEEKHDRKSNYEKGYDSDNTYVPPRQHLNLKRPKGRPKKNSNYFEMKQLHSDSRMEQASTATTKKKPKGGRKLKIRVEDYVLDTSTKKYKCPEPSCGSQFVSPHMAYQHHQAIHLKRRFTCNICNRNDFSYLWYMKKHQKNCKGNKKKEVAWKVKKIVLQKRRPKVEKAVHKKIRRKVASSGGKHKCADPSCPETFPTYYLANLHNRTVHRNILYKCDICKRDDFKWSGHLKYHKKTCEGDGIKRKPGRKPQKTEKVSLEGTIIQTGQNITCEEIKSNTKSDIRLHHNSTGHLTAAAVPTALFGKGAKIEPEPSTCAISPSKLERVGKISIKPSKLPSWKIQLMKEEEEHNNDSS